LVGWADNLYYLQGFSGHGVALTGLAGQMVAQAVAGQAERFDVFAQLEHRSFPRWALAAHTQLGAGDGVSPAVGLAVTPDAVRRKPTARVQTGARRARQRRRQRLRVPAPGRTAQCWSRGA